MKKKYNIFFLSRNINKTYKKILKKNNIKLISLNIKDKRSLNKYSSIFEKEEILESKSLLKKLYFKYIIIDNYSIASKWQIQIKKFCEKIIVIDDLNKKKHKCDILINSNILHKKKYIKENMINSNTKIYCGTKYIIINQKFINPKPMNINKNNIFVYFGSADKHYLLYKLYNIFSDKKFVKYNFFFILPDRFKNFNNFKKRRNLYLFKYNNNIETIMKKCSIAVGAAGQNLYERIAIKMYNLVISQSKIQYDISKKLMEKKIIYFLGNYNMTNKSIKQKIEKQLFEYNLSNKYINYKKLFDLNGLQRVIKLIENT